MVDTPVVDEWDAYEEAQSKAKGKGESVQNNENDTNRRL